MKQEIIYVPDIATFLGVSHAAIRGYIQRRDWPRSIPEPFRIGAKYAWRIDGLKKWLDEKSAQNNENKSDARTTS